MTNERTKALLRKLRDQLEFYGDQHASKTPPQVEKARVNYELVQEVNRELLLIATEEAGQPELSLEAEFDYANQKHASQIMEG